MGDAFWSKAFWVIVIAIIYLMVRPGSKAGQAAVSVVNAFAATVGKATGFGTGKLAGGE